MATLKYTITNSDEYINIDGISGTAAAGVSYSLNKVNINKIVKHADGFSIGIIMVDDWDTQLDYREVVNPVTGVAYISQAVMEASIEAMANSSGSSALALDTEFLKTNMDGFYYIGKASNGDFVTAYSAPGPNIIALSGYPAGLTFITDDDIEVIKQINTTGAVVATYARTSSVISVSTLPNIITVVGATFAATDTFIVYTNIPRSVLGDIDISAPADSSCYIGKSTNTNKGDFVVTHAGATDATLTITSTPPGTTALYAADVVSVVQFNATGTMVATYHRDDKTMLITAGVLTVTGALFTNTDVFVVYTNIPRQLLNNVMGTTYIGKATGATGKDFVTTYLAATQITLSAYPAGISAFTGDDIEFVRQISSTGTMLNSFTRANATFVIAANVLTIAQGAFNNTDTFVVVTNVAKIAASPSGVSGGNVIYTNAAGDFIATITNATKNITITGLPFTLEAMHVVAGLIKKITVTTNVVSNVVLTNVSVSGGVITLTDADNFATGDIVLVTLIGPDKAYDKTDYTKVLVGNPEYGHYTSVETLVSESALLPATTAPYKQTADAGGSATAIVDATGGFGTGVGASATAVGGSLVAEGYLAWSTTENASALVTSVNSATSITTGAGVADWSSDAYSLPLVKRYEIPMEGYNFLTLQYSLAALTFCNAYFKIYGTLDATATADSDYAWINLSADLLGAATGLSIAIGTTQTGLIVIDTPTTMLKYMVKLVVESASASSSTNAFTVLIKKSS